MKSGIFTLTTPIVIVLSLQILASCNILSPREPEPPNTLRNNFLPPTSVQIVLENFQASFRDKNVDNYLSCFAATSDSAESENGIQFTFEPSADALSRFPTFFEDYTLEQERRYFIGLVAQVPEDSVMKVEFANDNLTLAADSAVFVADYVLTTNQTDNSRPSIVAGRLQFILAAQTNGFWEIRQWADIGTSQPQDSVRETWSTLKAVFGN